MQKAICNHAVIPLRRVPSDKSELVSELLFGEICTLSDINENWALVKNDFDGYEGWIDQKQLRILSSEEERYLVNPECKILASRWAEVDTGNGLPLLLSFGSLFYKQISNEGIEIQSDNQQYLVCKPEVTTRAGELIQHAKKFLQVPYLWGGRSIFGVDCSGFVQLVFRVCGYSLPRDASNQVEAGSMISFIEEAQAADLAYFENDEGQIVHVGILLDSTQIIHASGKVRIDSIDHYGIFNHEQHRYTHRLRIIKRVLTC